MSTTRPQRRAAALAALFVLACAGEEPDAAISAAVPTPAVTLASAEALDVRNARMPTPGLLTGGQLTEAQLDGLVDAGYRHFISLRPAGEDGAGWEEARVTGPAAFVRIPVNGGAGLTRENVEALDRVLDRVGEEGAVLYCASGNRVGALLALRSAWLEGATPEEALALGRAAGLRGLEPAVAELLAAGS